MAGGASLASSSRFLPPDGNEGKKPQIFVLLLTHISVEFEELAAELTQPTKEDLLDLASRRSFFRKNRLHPFFLRLCDATKPDPTSRSSEMAISDLLDILLSSVSAIWGL